MNPKSYAVMFACGAMVALFSSPANAQTVLFDDNYNRGPSSGNLTPTFSGESGADVGSGITYLIPNYNVAANSVYSGSPAAAANTNTLEVNAGTLQKQNTGQEGIWALNYNFTDAAILSAGGFSVSENISALAANSNDPVDRFAGYGVGLSLNQVNSLADDFASNLGPRGSVGGPQATTGVSAFYVDLDVNGAVQIFTGGSLLQTIAIAGSPTAGTLETLFTGVSSFNAGQNVNFNVLFDGNSIATGAFSLENTGQNYIAGSMRDSTAAGGEFNVSTVPEPSVAAMIVGGLGAMGFFIRRRKI